MNFFAKQFTAAHICILTRPENRKMTTVNIF